MNRSSYRNLMVIALVVLLGISLVVFFQGQQAEQTVLDKKNQLTRVRQELENAARLSAALTELDQLTINEQTATQLDILRHLGLEQTEIDFVVESREVRTVGDANLYVRNVRMEGPMEYPTALYLLDRLHNTRKIVFAELTLEKAFNKKDQVRIRLSGRIYGLDKTAVAQPPSATPQVRR